MNIFLHDYGVPDTDTLKGRWHRGQAELTEATNDSYTAPHMGSVVALLPPRADKSPNCRPTTAMGY